VFDYDDFTETITSGSGKLGWYTNTTSGTFIGNSPFGVNNVDRAYGVLDLSCPNTAWLWMSLGDSNLSNTTGSGPLFPGMGIYQQEWRFALDHQYNPGGALFFFGLMNFYEGGGSYTSATDAICWVNYAANSLPTWNLFSSQLPGGGSHQTIQAITNAPIPGKFQKFKMVSNAAWTSWQFYIDDVAVGTPVTANLPVGRVTPFLQFQSSGSPTHHCYLDYFWHDYQYTR
jgi:hypothetical protein